MSPTIGRDRVFFPLRATGHYAHSDGMPTNSSPRFAASPKDARPTPTADTDGRGTSVAEAATRGEECPTARYEWATGPDGWLTVAGWDRLAGDMSDCAIERAMVGMPGVARMYMDRAADCRARAAKLRGEVRS